jgi:hypothetical protein
MIPLKKLFKLYVTHFFSNTPEILLRIEVVIDCVMEFHVILFRFWAHIGMSYVFSAWTCYSLYKEYMIVATMRLRFLASERRRPDQFTVS